MAQKPTQTRLQQFACVMMLIMVSLTTPNVWAKPFGLEMGMSLEQLAAYQPTPVKKQADVYRIETAPLHSSNFDHYLLRVDAEHGLCVVNAISKDILAEPEGALVQMSYTNLKSQLTAKYGQPAIDVDEIKNSSIWAAPQHWMHSLLSRQRTLTAIWSSQQTPLIDNIADIALTARAKSVTIANLSLTYEFKNLNACRQAEQQANAQRSNVSANTRQQTF